MKENCHHMNIDRALDQKRDEEEEKKKGTTMSVCRGKEKICNMVSK